MSEVDGRARNSEALGAVPRSLTTRFKQQARLAPEKTIHYRPAYCSLVVFPSEECMAYIYKITNKVNGKSYIGKTLKSVEDRFSEHCRERVRDRCKNRPLYRAMNKYGVENFEVSVLEEITDIAASEREIFWIDHFGTYSKGYNATKGGDGKQLIDHDKVIELAKTKTAPQIAKELNCDLSSIHSICKIYNIKPAKVELGATLRTPLICVERNMLVSSCSDASKYLDYPATHISRALKNKTKAGGFSWILSKLELIVPEE